MTGPGRREALPTVDRDFRIAQMRDPKSLANGDRKFLQKLENEELAFNYDRQTDDVEYCTGCDAAEDLRNMRQKGNNLLCDYCCSKFIHTIG